MNQIYLDHICALHVSAIHSM